MFKTLFCALLVALFVTSCESEDEVSNGTGTTIIEFGTVVGTGSDRQGIGGTFWSTGGPLYTFDAETDIADVDNVQLAGGSFTDAGVISFSGSTKTDVIGQTYTNCGEVQPNDAEFINNVIVSPSDRGLELLATNNIEKITCVAGSNTNQISTFGTNSFDDSISPSIVSTHPHTVASGRADVALLVLIGFEHTSDTIVSVAYDDVPLKRIGTVSNGTTITVEAWILYGPTEGSSLDITVTASAAPLNLEVDGINLEGVNRFSEIIVSSNTASAATAVATTIENVSIDSYSIDMVYTDVSAPGATFDATGGTATEIRDTAIGSEAAVAVASDSSGVGLRDHDWTWTGTANAAQLVVAIKSIGVEHAVHMRDIGDASIDFDAINFFGFGAAGAPKWHGENSESGADIDISAVNASNPAANEFENTHSTAGTVGVTNNVALTFTGLRDNTEVRIYTAGTTTELDGIENATAGTSDDREVTFSLTASISVDIRFAHGVAADGNVYTVPESNAILGFTWPTLTAELPITQVLDRSFSNPEWLT